MKIREGVQSEPFGVFDMVHQSPRVKSVAVTLDTSGASTTVTGAFPAWSRLIAMVAKVTTEVADVDATGFTVSIGGTTVLTSSDLNVHPAVGGAIGWNPATSVETTATAANMRIALTGGTDQTPSAGAITVEFVYESWN